MMPLLKREMLLVNILPGHRSRYPTELLSEVVEANMWFPITAEMIGLS
jgi:hypothetical protein